MNSTQATLERGSFAWWDGGHRYLYVLENAGGDVYKCAKSDGKSGYWSRELLRPWRPSRHEHIWDALNDYLCFVIQAHPDELDEPYCDLEAPDGEKYTRIFADVGPAEFCPTPTLSDTRSTTSPKGTPMNDEQRDKPLAPQKVCGFTWPDGDEPDSQAELQKLLDDGWRVVGATPLRGDYGYAVVYILEKVQ